ncbi:MAG: hypothetical protein PQ975_00715 [Methanobacterium sp.]
MVSMACKWLLALILVNNIFLFPVYANHSSQSVSVAIHPSTAASMTYTEDNSPVILPLPFGNGDYIGNIRFTNPSNQNTELWIKVNGINTETGDTFKLNDIKYRIQGTDKQKELKDSYTKAGVLNNPEQGSKEIPALNFNIMSSTIPDNCTVQIYITSIKYNSTVPAI